MACIVLCGPTNQQFVILQRYYLLLKHAQSCNVAVQVMKMLS